MWIGERITENGIGNGVSLLIMAGIVSNMFNWGRQAVVGMAEGRVNPLAVIVIVIALLAMIVAITFVDMGERRIPIQYAKRVVGNKMYGGQTTCIPIKINSSGVLPLIFASPSCSSRHHLCVLPNERQHGVGPSRAASGIWSSSP